MFKAFFNINWKHAGIWFNNFFTWVLVNVVICMLPIIVSTFIQKSISENILSGIISYSFTLTIASTYLFEKFSKPKSLIKWVGITISFIFISLFIYYPALSNSDEVEYAKENGIWISISLISLTFIINFILNFKSLNEEARHDLMSQKFESKSSSSKMNEDDFKRNL